MEEWTSKDWLRYLKRALVPGVFIAGYNFNKSVGVHLIKVRYDDGDPQVVERCKRTVEGWLNGTVELPAQTPPNIDVTRSRRYHHPDDVFNTFRDTDFQLDAEEVYGDSTIFNHYLDKLPSQKLIQPLLEAQTWLFILDYIGDEKELAELSYEFIKSFDGLNLMKIKLCETYSARPKVDDWGEDLDEARTLTVLEFALGEHTRHPEGALNKIRELMLAKGERCQLKWLDDWFYSDLKLYW